jgi:hypothetical protein
MIWIRFAHRFGTRMTQMKWVAAELFVLFVVFATNARMIRFAHGFGTQI